MVAASIWSHWVLRLSRSHCSSSTERPTPAVRTMAPMPSGICELVHDLAHLVAVFALDAARDAPGARVVRHQHQEAAGEADERGEGRALGAALFLFDLDDEFLAFGEQLADVHRGRPAAAGGSNSLEISFSGRKPWRCGAVVDETGFERGLDAGDPAFVDVGFFLFAGGELDAEIVKFLTINQSDAQLFLLSCIDEHSFHVNWPLVTSVGPTRVERRISCGRHCRRPRGAEVQAVRPKIVCEARDVNHVCNVRPADGAERRKPFGVLHRRRAADALLDVRRRRATIHVGLQRWPRYRGPTNMRRVRVVIKLRSAVPRHCVVTHSWGRRRRAS